MKTDTRERIIDFVEKNEKVTAKSIIQHSGLTPPAVFRQLKKLQEDGLLEKQGKPPKVFYFLVRTSPLKRKYAIDPKIRQVIEEHFLKIRADGILQSGLSAFVPWCLARNVDPVKTSIEYAQSIKKFDAYKKNNLIDGMFKMKNTFKNVYLDHLYYLEFYTIERFGKTKLGELILYAKQSQNIGLTKVVVDDVREKILKVIKRFDIDAVGYIPPTVKREVQFMKALEKQLKLPRRLLKITKVKTPIIVPQKTLTKLHDRVENAVRSLVLEETEHFKNVLLIDDAVGSGATINEVARQIRAKDLCQGEIVGLGLTGSFSGFEIIQEV